MAEPYFSALRATRLEIPLPKAARITKEACRGLISRALSDLAQSKSRFDKFVLHQVRHSALAKQDDAVRIRSFGHVIYAPAIGGLGEFLVVDEHQRGLEADRDARSKKRS